MEELVRHLWNNNREVIMEKSLLNCHVLGLHSIMLIDSPGQTIRLYVDDEGSEMYKNTRPFYQRGMSLGFHPHHCNLTLQCVKGSLFNWIVRDAKGLDSYTQSEEVYDDQYEYQSLITTGKQGFKLVKKDKLLITHRYDQLKPGNFIRMKASDIHTVGCTPFEVNAWLVFEGKEDSSYSPDCYSTSDLTAVNTKGLYQKPTERQVCDLLVKSGLLSELYY